MHVIRHLFICCLAFLAFGVAAQEKKCVGILDGSRIASVWSGVRVAFDAVEDENNIFIGYFDHRRQLAVMKINKCSGLSSSVKLASEFNGWDSHNYITMVLDKSGRLHVAGNMHSSKLVYAKAEKPGDIESLRIQDSMVGRDEDLVTYPKFFFFSDGSLGFNYRQGSSGRGVEFVNKYSAGKWVRQGDGGIFSGDKIHSVSAYHTGFYLGQDGYFHVAWVWRKNINVETNFNINYARSKNLINWEDSSGRILSTPLTPDNSEVVDHVPTNSGLFNNIKIGFDAGGKVVISYLKFDDAGVTQLWHARSGGDSWSVYKSSNWSYRWDPKGRGSIPVQISFNGVEFRDGALLEEVQHFKYGKKLVKYNPLSFKIVQEDALKAIAFQLDVKENISGKVRKNVRKATGDSEFVIQWNALSPNTRDKKKPCAKKTYEECGFVSDMFIRKVIDK